MAMVLAGFVIAAYATTVAAIAFYNYRILTLEGQAPTYGSMLLWQALIFSIWVPVAAWIWKTFRRSGLTRPTMRKFLSVGAILIPVHSVMSMLLFDTHWAQPGTIDLKAMLAQRAQVDFLLYASFGILALAAYFQRRAALEAMAAADLKLALGAAQAALRTAGKDKSAPAPMMVSVGSRRVMVEAEHVEWFGSAGNYVVVNWAGKEGLIRSTLGKIEQDLNQAVFARAHRGTIVNLGAVTSAESLADGSWRLVMRSGAEVIVSRTFRDTILARLGKAPKR